MKIGMLKAIFDILQIEVITNKLIFTLKNAQFLSISQYGCEESNKSLEDGDETFAALKSTLQRFRIHFFQNPSFEDVESTSYAAHPIWPEWAESAVLPSWWIPRP